MEIAWDEGKNRRLVEERNISFEEVALRLSEGDFIDIRTHPNQERYPGQYLLLFWKDEQVYCAPFVWSQDGIFLKTCYPSRRLTRMLKGETE